MPEFHVTFGQRYAREEHPTWPAAHPDGWLTIVADTEQHARAAAARLLAAEPGGVPHYAFLHPADGHDTSWYPAGELGRVDQDGHDLPVAGR